jgi:hypothetical protein
MSPEDLDVVDRQRRRWLRARAPLRLVDPDADDFSTGGLASRVSESTVRLLLLAADPGAWLLDFDAEFWSWWRQDGVDPTSGQLASWGYDNLPTEFAALRTAIVENGRLAKYLALHRSGALELELGEDGAFLYPDSGQRVFRLVTIVRRVRAALQVWTGIRDHLRLDGPMELSLALRGTQGAILGNLAEGYAKPRPGMSSRLCPTKHLLLRRDLWEWPDETHQLDLALSVGGWLEDAWGGQERRFLTPHGPLQGQLDRSR